MSMDTTEVVVAVAVAQCIAQDSSEAVAEVVVIISPIKYTASSHCNELPWDLLLKAKIHYLINNKE